MDGQAPTREQIVEAVMQLPPMQWAMQKMAEPEPGPGGMDQLSPSGSAAPPPGFPPSAPATDDGGPSAASHFASRFGARACCWIRPG